MKRIKKVLSILVMTALVISMSPAPVNAAAKLGKPKITKVTVSQQKVTVQYSKVKKAKSYTIYNAVSKTGWKYIKKVKASKANKYSNKKKYKLVKNGKKYKVYQKAKIITYKKLASSKSNKAVFKGNWGTTYYIVVRAFKGKKAGAYSAVKTVKIGKKPVPKPVEPVYREPDKDKYETYVFFGSDSRANDESWKSPGGGRITKDKSGTQGTPRSDVIMLLNVNREAKTINIVSIYRDTAMNKDVNDGDKINFQKANKAYADYGPKQACKVLEENLDIKIKGYAAANFKGVADVIDDLGGVTVSGLNDKTTSVYKDKGDDVVDIANGCLDEMNKAYGLYGTVSEVSPIERGADTQELRGLQAVAYARVRYTEGSDMQRSVRQRAVLKDMIRRYKGLSDSAKLSIFTANEAGIETDLGLQEMAELVKAVSGYKIVDSGFPYYKIGYTKSTTEEIDDEAYLFLPCDLKTNVNRLHNLVYGEDWYVASPTVVKYSDALEKELGYGYKDRKTELDDKY